MNKVDTSSDIAQILTYDQTVEFIEVFLSFLRENLHIIELMYDDKNGIFMTAMDGSHEYYVEDILRIETSVANCLKQFHDGESVTIRMDHRPYVDMRIEDYLMRLWDIERL